MELYGREIPVSNKQRVSLREIKLNFHTEARSAYGDDVEYIHQFNGNVLLQVIDYDPYTVKILGREKYIASTGALEIPFTQLPEDLQQELKYIWGRVEKAIEESVKNEGH